MDFKNLSLLNKKFPNENYPTVLIHLLYLMTSFTFCFLYYHKLILPLDFYKDEYGSVIRVLNIEATRAIQYRLLVPIIYKIFSLPMLLPDKGVFFVVMFGFVYLTLISFFRLLNIYFSNVTFNNIAALFIIYPMIWNFFGINQIFFFNDTAIIFFMTLCLYFVVSKKNNWLLLAFFLGTANHYSIGFMIPVFLLFNYKSLLTKKNILYSFGMTVIFVGYFLVVRMFLPDLTEERDNGFVAWQLSSAWQAIAQYKIHFLIRDLLLNLGGLHFFALMFLLSGIWKKIKIEYISVFLILLPFTLFALLRLGIRIEEIRNYIPIIPFVILPALIFISGFINKLLKLAPEITRFKQIPTCSLIDLSKYKVNGNIKPEIIFRSQLLPANALAFSDTAKSIQADSPGVEFYMFGEGSLVYDIERFIKKEKGFNSSKFQFHKDPHEICTQKNCVCFAAIKN